MMTYKTTGTCSRAINYEIENGVDSRFHLAFKKERRKRAKSARRASADDLRWIDAKTTSERRRVVDHPAFQPFDDFGRRAFLRAKDPRRSVCADERVCDVVHYRYARLSDSGIEPGDVDFRDAFQIAPATFKLASFRVEETNAKRPAAARSAVDRRDSA